MPTETKLKKQAKDEIATSQKDIDIYAGWLTRLENPDPVIRAEANGKGLKLYDEVDRDPHAGAVLQSRYLSVVGKDWDVLPGEDGNRAAEIAGFVERALTGCNFNQARQELLQAILFGFYVAEVLWQIKDGAVVPYKIRAKHPRRFVFTLDRELRLLTPADMIEGEQVPERKFLRFTYGSSDNPYGKGLGQKLWWSVWFKKHGIKFWLVYLEKFGMPTGIGKYPSGAEPEQQAALLDALGAIQTETGIKIPDTMTIELLEAIRSGTATYETLCEYMDKQISKAVLGQIATTEGTPGKLGKEEAQEETKQDIVVADAGLLDECLNGSLVQWLVDFNFPGVNVYPKIQTRTEGEKDLKAQAERDRLLTRDVGLPVGKRYFYETYAIPEPDPGEEIVVPGNALQRQADTAEFSERSFSQIEVDALAGQGAVDAAEAVAEMVQPVLDMIDGVGSLEEIGEKIYGLYPELDSERFQELLTRAMFAAVTTGYAASGEDEE